MNSEVDAAPDVGLSKNAKAEEVTPPVTAMRADPTLDDLLFSRIPTKSEFELLLLLTSCKASDVEAPVERVDVEYAAVSDKATLRMEVGLVVPIPTLPAAVIRRRSARTSAVALEAPTGAVLK